MQILATPLGFPYPMTCVPKRARNERTEYFSGSDSAAVRRIEPSEALIAFRILYPEMDLFRLREAATLDLLFYENEIWWPHCDDCEFPAEQVSGDQLLKAIEAGDCSREFLPYRFRLLDLKKERPEIRSKSFDGHDSFCALAQRKVYENFLICGESAFIRGGVPVLFKNTHGYKTVWEIDVASIGPGRSADQAALSSRGAPGISFDRNSIQALCNGNFWLTNEQDVAQRAKHRMQARIPRIEVLLPDLVRDARRDIQLDALFRSTRQLFVEPWCDRWNSRAASEFKGLLQHISTETLHDLTTTQRRRGVLRQFFDVTHNCVYDELSRLRQDFIAFDKEEEQTLFSSRALDPKDADHSRKIADRHPGLTALLAVQGSCAGREDPGVAGDRGEAPSSLSSSRQDGSMDTSFALMPSRRNRLHSCHRLTPCQNLGLGASQDRPQAYRPSDPWKSLCRPESSF